ncbi:MAG: response regulator, partial [Geobacter sp.]|nr:response regulator [Geobacter sp.]
MGSKVLLADDSVTIQKVVGIIFANEGYELTVVASGDAALAKAREIKPDVMLIDALMPGKNGYEVCREVRQDPALAHTAILLMTGTFEAVDEERNRQSGADDFITKPFESQMLIDATNRLIALTAERAAAPKAAAAAPAPAVEAAPVVPPAAPQVDDIWATGFDDEPAAPAPTPEVDVFAMAPEAPAPVKATADDDLWGAFDMDAAAEPPAAAPAAAAASSAVMSDDIFSFDSTAP